MARNDFCFIRFFLKKVFQCCNVDTGKDAYHLHCRCMNISYPVADPVWKKGSVTDSQIFISCFSIKPHFLLRLEIDR